MIVIKFGRHDNQPKGPETDERRKTQKRKEMDQNFKLASPGKQTTSGLRGDWNTHNVVRLHRINDFENYRHQGTWSCSRLDVARNTITQFEEILDRNLPFGITSEIYQEVLQGADSKRDFSKLQTYLASQKFYHPIDPIVSYEQAAELYFTCRRHCRRQAMAFAFVRTTHPPSSSVT